MMRELMISPEDGQEKSRSFRAVLLAEAFCEALVNPGNTLRPAWMMLAASHAEVGPFVANLRAGRKAEIAGTGYGRRGDRYEFLRSLGYAFASQRLRDATVITAYLPEFVALDPGMVDPAGAKFFLIAERAWLTGGTPLRALGPVARSMGYTIPDELATDLALLAPLFCAYLDRRTRAPLIPDPVFYFRVLLACLQEGAASLPSSSRYRAQHGGEFGQHVRLGLTGEGWEQVGMLPPIAFSAKHEGLEALLAEQAKAHFAGRRAA